MGSPGDHHGAIQVRLGDQEGEIPVSIKVVPKEKDLARVLIVTTPFQARLTENARVFEPLLRLVQAAKIDVNYAEELPALA